MGCDIHITLERKPKSGGEWLGVFCSDIGNKSRPYVARRRYHLFAQLAGVRGDVNREIGGQYQRFLPSGVSKLALDNATKYGTDGHSHSWLTIDEFLEIWKATVEDNDYARHAHIEYDLFGLDRSDETYGDALYDWRVVFYFDN